MQNPPSILELTPEEFRSALKDAGEKAFRAGQVLTHVFGHDAERFDEMHNLPKPLRSALAEKYSIFTSTVAATRTDGSGNKKLLIKLHDKNFIETVLMPEGGRSVLCVSTQAGCPIRCRICASGANGFTRNLSAGEIVEQFLHAKRTLAPTETVQGVVYMGMGEPLLNVDAVMKSIRILNARSCGGVGARHITVSTIGVPAGIKEFMKLGMQARLAISLHSVRDDVRGKIIPHPPSAVKKLLSLAEDWSRAVRRRVTFEYVLIKGLNDSISDARELAKAVKHLRPFVNLIPMNPVAGCGFKAPSRRQTEIFTGVLAVEGIDVHVRHSMGVSVGAGCGQLAARSAKQTPV